MNAVDAVSIVSGSRKSLPSASARTLIMTLDNTVPVVPSSILGNHFEPAASGRYTALLHQDFWLIHRPEKDELRGVGISVGKDDDGTWLVVYNPHYDSAGKAAGLLAQLEAAYAPKIDEARALRAASDRETEIRVARARQDHEDWLDANGDLIRDTIAKARALQEDYGESLHDKATIARMLCCRATPLMVSDLQRAIAAAERKIAGNSRQYSKKTGVPVTWPDRVVIRAVEVLTELDRDRSEERNDVGWDAFQSSMGHWCNGALKDARYRENGLKLSRVLLGRYIDQLAIYMPEYPDLTKAS